MPGSKESGESVVSQCHVTNHTTTTHPLGSTSGKFLLLQIGYGHMGFEDSSDPTVALIDGPYVMILMGI